MVTAYRLVAYSRDFKMRQTFVQTAPFPDMLVLPKMGANLGAFSWEGGELVENTSINVVRVEQCLRERPDFDCSCAEFCYIVKEGEKL